MNNFVLTDLLKEDVKLAYHSTSSYKSRQIQRTGILRDHETKDVVEKLSGILSDIGYQDKIPFDRKNVVYCHWDTDYVSERVKEESRLGSNMRTKYIAVDICSIDCDIFAANMSLLNDLLDYHYAGEEQMIHADTPEEVASLYCDSITEIDTDKNVCRQISDIDGHIEFCINGDIRPESLVGVF